MASSKRFLARDQPDGADAPVVVNIKSTPAFRFTAPMSSRNKGGNGSTMSGVAGGEEVITRYTQVISQWIINHQAMARAACGEAKEVTGACNAKGQAVADDAGKVTNLDGQQSTAAYALAAIPARYALERRAWKEATAVKLAAPIPWAKYPNAEAIVHYARSVGSARSAIQVSVPPKVNNLMPTKTPAHRRGSFTSCSRITSPIADVITPQQVKSLWLVAVGDRTAMYSKSNPSKRNKRPNADAITTTDTRQ